MISIIAQHKTLKTVQAYRMSMPISISHTRLLSYIFSNQIVKRISKLFFEERDILTIPLGQIKRMVPHPYYLICC